MDKVAVAGGLKKQGGAEDRRRVADPQSPLDAAVLVRQMPEIEPRARMGLIFESPLGGQVSDDDINWPASPLSSDDECSVDFPMDLSGYRNPLALDCFEQSQSRPVADSNVPFYKGVNNKNK